MVAPLLICSLLPLDSHCRAEGRTPVLLAQIGTTRRAPRHCTISVVDACLPADLRPSLHCPRWHGALLRLPPSSTPGPFPSTYSWACIRTAPGACPSVPRQRRPGPAQSAVESGNLPSDSTRHAGFRHFGIALLVHGLLQLERRQECCQEHVYTRQGQPVARALAAPVPKVPMRKGLAA